jgi:hypothetical protein
LRVPLKQKEKASKDELVLSLVSSVVLVVVYFSGPTRSIISNSFYITYFFKGIHQKRTDIDAGSVESKTVLTGVTRLRKHIQYALKLSFVCNVC